MRNCKFITHFRDYTVGHDLMDTTLAPCGLKLHDSRMGRSINVRICKINVKSKAPTSPVSSSNLDVSPLPTEAISTKTLQYERNRNSNNTKATSATTGGLDLPEPSSNSYSPREPIPGRLAQRPTAALGSTAGMAPKCLPG